MKFIFYTKKFVLPLLTILLWLVPTCGSSSAQQHVMAVTTRRTQQSPPQQPVPLSRSPTLPLSPSPHPPIPHSPQLLYSGTQVSLNSRTFHVAWSQRQLDGLDKVHTGISDAGLIQLLGVELLNTKNAAKQPVQWFSQPTNTPLVLTSWLTSAYRYLDMTELARTSSWQLSVAGDTLLITTPAARVVAIHQDQQSWEDTCRRGLRQVSVGKSPWETLPFKNLLERDRLIVDLDRPTPWQITQVKIGRGASAVGGFPDLRSQPRAGVSPHPHCVGAPKPPVERTGVRLAWSDGARGREEWLITIDATIAPALIQHFNSSPVVPPTPGGHKAPPLLPHSPSPPQQSPSIKIGTDQFQTILRMEVPFGLHPHVATLPNPNRLVIDLRPDAMVERDILWAPGLRWRQQFLNIGASRFPVVWLEINLRAFGLKLKPIWSDPATLVGIAPLLQTAQRYAAAAAINGGFFNRNEQLPLGAIRRDGRWFSSPILNRGAIAWNDAGQVKIGRLSVQETLISTGKSLPILAFNSGYLKAGASRYSWEWGPTYTPLSANEIIVVVQNNIVTAHLPGGIAGRTAFRIPPNGYLLALRDNSAAANSLPVGTLVRDVLTTAPADFAHYSQILAAGPLLVQNRQVILDAKAEQFSDAFVRETAVRSAIGITKTGTLLIVAVHNQTGGGGPTLAEIALVTQRLGCVDALNLDGGSSTSLYLGGQLLNRSPYTAARVHNGLGVFLQPLEQESSEFHH